MSNNFIDHNQELVVLYNLYASNSLEDVFGVDLLPSDFHKPEHQEIFEQYLEAASSLTGRKSLSTISNKLSPKCEEYWHNTVTADFRSGDLEYATNVVKECSRKRQLQKTLNKCLAELVEKKTDDVVEIMGSAAMELTFDSNKAFISQSPEIVGSCLEKIERHKMKLPIEGVKTGIESIDSRIGYIENKEVTIIAAPSSHGKTAMGLNMAYNQLVAGKSVGYISFEMSEDALGLRLATIRSNDLFGNDGCVSIDKMKKGYFRADEYEKLEKCTMDLANFNLSIVNKPKMTLSEIIATAKRMKTAQGIDVLYVDYVQQVMLDKSMNTANREREVSIISATLRDLAVSLNIPIVLLAQVNRNVETQKRVPYGADIRESSTIQHDADKLLLFWRPARVGIKEIDGIPIDRGYIQMNIDKNRVGETGIIALQMNETTTYIQDFEYKKPYDSDIPF